MKLSSPLKTLITAQFDELTRDALVGLAQQPDLTRVQRTAFWRIAQECQAAADKLRSTIGVQQ